ncbi:Fic family protein [Mycolicibacterium sp.]|uniref:type II toxin-antitoxin system death-on-curing family toxin n=1 Tax=Mycolicibacterium sp. TaxID=2320850 RepID=UPI0025DB0F0E|nr:Fic family protein [Mycolicibacterium sp.]
MTAKPGFTVADHGLVESALNRPRASVFGVDAYVTIQLKAAALLQSKETNRVLADGNRRTARSVTRLFCGLNSYGVCPTEQGRFDLSIAAATRQLDTAEKIGGRFEATTVSQ